MTDHTELIKECHRMALTVAPELAAQPLYLLDAAEDECLRGPETYAHANISTHFDPVVKEVLGDRYVGPGAIIAIDFARIKEDADDFRLAVMGVMAHEVAHVVPAQVVQPPYPASGEFLAACKALYAKSLAVPGALPGAPDESHGVAFVRRCAHVAHRANAAGFPVHFRDTLLGSFMFPSWCDYLVALDSEANRLVGATFREIEATPMPEAFLAFWRADVARGAVPCNCP